MTSIGAVLAGASLRINLHQMDDCGKDAHEQGVSIAPLRSRRTGYCTCSVSGVTSLAALATALATSAVTPTTARAQDATWQSAPASGDFKSAANWTPATVPLGTATFGSSATTAISLSAPATSLGGFSFAAGAPTYSFTIKSGQTLGLTGNGVVGASANAPVFNLAGPSDNSSTATFLNFSGASTAANATINALQNSAVQFSGTSTAGQATIAVNGTTSAFRGREPLGFRTAAQPGARR